MLHWSQYQWSLTRKKQIIDNFNQTPTYYPKEKTLIQLFEEQVNLHPDKKALVFKEQFYSYRQLNELSNSLGRNLRHYGVISNTPVGILADKSLELIVGILGILKAGGCYVPIDPDYPQERINYMISDSGVKTILTQEKYMKMPLDGITKIDLNSKSSYNKDKSNPGKIQDSSSLAYIMYTSGTTGKPKGSAIYHYSVTRLVRNTNYIEITPSDSILLTGAIVFDASTFEIWGALLNGGTLHIVEKEIILDANALGRELIQNNITILWLTSPLFTQIAEKRTDIFAKLKYLLVGGDILSPPHINKVRKNNPGLKVINGYGPTENTTFSTTYLIEKDFETNIPVGKPISNSTAYILDKHLNYQPIGVIGELCVGGDGLSKGYVNRDDLTNKSFVNHPQIPGQRIYKTGDYARWLPDGNIELHGRADNQFKIRGFRVELEEIQSVLSDIEGVIDSVVVPIKLKSGETGLAAFLNVPDNFSLDTKSIIRHIKQKLAPYMVPSILKLMNGFPKTINGKIDIGAMLVDIPDKESSEMENLNSLSKSEKTIYNIWCESLYSKDISLADNFFEIGGNSLLAISLFSKIQTAFNVDLKLRQFFDSPTIKDLAEAVDIELKKSFDVESTEKTDKKDMRIIQGVV